ncbi:hypothetical protein HDV05_003647 [Chytridiales sp. JEL 0842]|nr:hypothetical protein HDV05_003647 [Chytridiales sp. JEL 0842]
MDSVLYILQSKKQQLQDAATEARRRTGGGAADGDSSRTGQGQKQQQQDGSSSSPQPSVSGSAESRRNNVSSTEPNAHRRSSSTGMDEVVIVGVKRKSMHPAPSHPLEPSINAHPTLQQPQQQHQQQTSRPIIAASTTIHQQPPAIVKQSIPIPSPSNTHNELKQNLQTQAPPLFISTNIPSTPASPAPYTIDDPGTPSSSTSHQQPSKRRKTCTACIACQKAHVSCEAKRPCTRCVKRGQGDMCTDAPRKAVLVAAAKAAAVAAGCASCPMAKRPLLPAPGGQPPSQQQGTGSGFPVLPCGKTLAVPKKPMGKHMAKVSHTQNNIFSKKKTEVPSPLVGPLKVEEQSLSPSMGLQNMSERAPFVIDEEDSTKNMNIATSAATLDTVNPADFFLDSSEHFNSSSSSNLINTPVRQSSSSTINTLSQEPSSPAPQQQSCGGSSGCGGSSDSLAENPNCMFNPHNIAKDSAFSHLLIPDLSNWSSDMLLGDSADLAGMASVAEDPNTPSGFLKALSSGAGMENLGEDASTDLNLIASLLNIWSTDVAPFESLDDSIAAAAASDALGVGVGSNVGIMPDVISPVSAPPSMISSLPHSTIAPDFSDPNLTVVQPLKKKFATPGKEWCGDEKCLEGCASLRNANGLTPGWNMFSNTMPPAKQPNAVTDQAVTKLHDYTQGYIQLDKYLNAHISSLNRVRVITSLTRLQPSFHSATAGLTEPDFFTSEMAFQSYLQDHDIRFPRTPSTSHPPRQNQEAIQAIWRRTGEIHRVSPAFADLLGIAQDILQSGKIGIYELLTEDSCVAYFERYAEVAFESGKGSAGVVSGCVVRDPRVGMGLGLSLMMGAAGGNREEEEEALKRKGPVSCLLSFVVKRDQWGVPVAIVGTFVPVVGCPVIGNIEGGR